MCYAKDETCGLHHPRAREGDVCGTSNSAGLAEAVSKHPSARTHMECLLARVSGVAVSKVGWRLDVRVICYVSRRLRHLDAWQSFVSH